MQKISLYDSFKQGKTPVNALSCHKLALKLYDIPNKVPDDILYPVIL